LDALWQAISDAPSSRGRLGAAGPELLQAAQERLAAAFDRAERSSEPRLRALLAAYDQGVVSADEAAVELVRLLLETRAQPEKR
jgi:hypothetical protein